MGQPPKKKGLSAHQAGIPKTHRKPTYDPDAAPADRPGDLTAREEEISLLLAQDYTNAEISKKTRIKLATVKSHIHNLLAKIGGRNRASAIIWLLRRELAERDQKLVDRDQQLAARDREILMLKEVLAQGGSSAAPQVSAASPRRKKSVRRSKGGKAATAEPQPAPLPPDDTTQNRT